MRCHVLTGCTDCQPSCLPTPLPTGPSVSLWTLASLQPCSTFQTATLQLAGLPVVGTSVVVKPSTFAVPGVVFAVRAAPFHLGAQLAWQLLASSLLPRPPRIAILSTTSQLSVLLFPLMRRPRIHILRLCSSLHALQTSAFLISFRIPAMGASLGHQDVHPGHSHDTSYLLDSSPQQGTCHSPTSASW
jgi:hypothetical protein